MKLVYELTLTCFSLLVFILSDFDKLPLITTILSFYLSFLVCIAVKYTLSKDNTFTELITTQPEKNRIRFVLILVLNLCLLFAAIEPYIVKHFKIHTPAFYSFNHKFAWGATIIFCLSFLLLPTFKILKFNGKVDKLIGKLKTLELLHNEFESKVFTLHRKITSWCAKILRKYHVSIALIGILTVFIHTFLAIVNGFKWTYAYISGYAALFDLLLLSVIGLLRFRKLDKGIHKILSYIFLLLTILHIVFSELRI